MSMQHYQLAGRARAWAKRLESTLSELQSKDITRIFQVLRQELLRHENGLVMVHRDSVLMPLKQSEGATASAQVVG
jgi:hypothetical protein